MSHTRRFVIAGMHEAQAECKWLHEQLQAALKADATGGDGSGSAALRMQLASSLAPACSPAAAALPAGSSSSGGGGSTAGLASLEHRHTPVLTDGASRPDFGVREELFELSLLNRIK